MSGELAQEPCRRRVLMLEDNDKTMKSTRDYLAWKLSCDVDLTAEAQLTGKLPTTHYDLIILDVMIHSETRCEGGNAPNVQFDGVPWDRAGLEFLRRLRRGDFSGPGGTPADVPVIILSAKLRSSVEREVKDEMALRGWFEKPCDFDRLVRAITTAWDNRQ